jgi:Ca-activated chloride channel homolog
MSFGSPGFLLLLLVVPAILGFALEAEHRRARYAVAFTNLELLATLATPPRAVARWISLGLFLLALAAASTAVARPRMASNVPAQQATIVLLVDVSGSMSSSDVRPTRLDAAQRALNVFLARIPPATMVGLVSFSDSPTRLVEPTRDRELLRASLELLRPEAGTAIGEGLAAAVHVAKSSLGNATRARDGKLPAAIVLLSDGTQTRGALTPQQGAMRAEQAGIRVYAIGLGTNNGVPNQSGIGGPGPRGRILGFGGRSAAMPPDLATLAAIAETTNGKAYLARSGARLDAIYRGLGSHLLRKRTVHEISSWFAGLAALLLLPSLVVSRLTGPRLP